jgi:hypothetical protein
MHITRSVRSLLIAMMLLAVPAASFAGVFVSITVGPPALPVYVQPVCPGDGYIWTPGYWAYGPDGYYWVPGTWVIAPAVGLLWTPGYWGWGGGFYAWHAGYWGPHVGFYGGINYGFGYGGVGYAGGYWNHGVFNYNRTVNNVSITNIHNVYNTTVVNNTTVNRVSYNGGTGGITARPTAAEEMAEREHHVEPTAMQAEHERTASTNRAQLASVNHGRPEVAATGKPGEFRGSGVVKATQTGEPYKPGAGARANNSVPRPGNNTAHTEIASRNAAASPSGVPRPPSSSRPESAPRTEAASHSQSAPRPSTPPRETSHPQSAPRPARESHPPSGREAHTR